jgi:APA family basic amino acid/polyamine antiporter
VPNQLLKTKSIDDLVEETHHESKRLKRSLGPWSLIAFGIGAVIGGGIFTVTGNMPPRRSPGSFLGPSER